MTASLPLAKRFLALNFCDPNFRREWLALERSAHDEDLFDFHRIRGAMLSGGAQIHVRAILSGLWEE